MRNILILLFASFAIIACGGEEDKKGKDNGWSKADQDSFKKEMCLRSGDKRCDCILSEISKDYSSYEDLKNKIESMEKMADEIDASESKEDAYRMMDEVSSFRADMEMIGEKCEEEDDDKYDDGMYDDGMYDDEAKIAPEQYTSAYTSDWSDYQIQEMVDECVREGAPSVDVCECMVFALSDVFTYSEFKSMENKSDNELTDSEREKTQEFMMMMMECMPK